MEELSDEQKSILEERLTDYEANPDQVVDWDEVKEDLTKRYELTSRVGAN